MQTWIRFTIVLFLFTTLLSCQWEPSKNVALWDFVPVNSETVLKVKRWNTTLSDFKSHPFLENIKDEAVVSFFRNNNFLPILNPSGEVLVSFVNKEDLPQFTLITKYHDSLLKKARVPKVIFSSSSFNKFTIEKASLDKQHSYSAIKDSVFIWSTSEEVLKLVLASENNKDVIFEKSFKAKQNKELVYIKKLATVQENDSLKIPLATWSSFELELLPDGIVGNGILLPNDSVTQFLNVFKEQIPKKNEAANIIPLDAKSASVYTFNNIPSLQKNLISYRGDSISIPVFFETIEEVASINFNNTIVIATRSIDSDLSWDYIAKYLSEKEPYRETPLYSFTPDIPFFETLPFLHTKNSSWVFKWDDFLIFTPTEATAQSLINSYLTSSVLSKAPFFENTQPLLAQSATFVKYDLKETSQGLFPALLGTQKIEHKKFPLAITQWIYDRDFAHLSFVVKEIGAKKSQQNSIHQLFSTTLSQPILNTAQFFTNHTTQGKDIVVQDVKNNLYFIGGNGKTLWKKQLDGAILGKIEEIDVLRNGKKQMAFVTKNTFYILDRNGKEVAPFPKKFKDPITQPLSVFDYDNNRKYRFIVTQNKEVFMYNTQGNIVNGFNFKKTNSSIVLPPQHIRIGNKDYILIAEENGKLNILSRTGAERIKVSQTISFSKNPIEKEGNNFVVITKENTKESISENGKVSSQKIEVSNNYWFTIYKNTKVTLDDNLLRINGKLVDLPLGVYTKPQLFSVGKKTYIATTATGESKIYVFETTGKLLPNLPIYGTDQVDVGDANKNGKLNILAKGDENELILYEIE